MSPGTTFRRSGPLWVWLVPNITLFLVVASIATLLWFVHRYESELQMSGLARDIQWAETAASAVLRDDQEFVDRLARALSEGTEGGGHAEQAGVYLARNPALRNFVWNAPGGLIVWRVTPARSTEELLRERPPSPELERMLRLTAAMGRPTYSAAYRDNVGEPYIEYHSPVLRRGEFLGTLSTTYRLRDFLKHVLPANFAARYHVALFDADGAQLYAREQPGAGEPLHTQSVALTLPWRDLRLVATSYKTDSILAQGALIVLTGLLATILIWSLWQLRRHLGKRLEADHALQASHERFVTVMDALDAAVCVAGFERGEILFMNEAFRREFAPGSEVRELSDVEGAFSQPPHERFPRSDLVDAAGAPRPALKAEFQSRDSGKWSVVRAKAIRWVDGRLVRMHMVSDITDRKAAEAKSRQQQEKLILTSRLMSVGEMASTIAHELNQPLAAIANYVTGCVKRLRDGNWNAEQLAVAMERSAAQTERAGRIVQRVRELVRGREPTFARVELNAVVRDVAQLVEIEAEHRGIDIRLDLDRTLAPVVADRIMLEQVLVNLVKNGMEAMQDTPEGERVISIATGAGVKDTIEVSVSDRGPGIDAEVEPELFSPFFTTKPHGMGIGLNLCRSIVEMHEGRLWFSRNPDRGSTFRFTIPTQG